LKKFLVFFGALVLVLNISTSVLAAPKVVLDGQQLSFDVPPIIEDGRTLVPLRAIFEALGANVSWDENTQSITATKADTSIKLQINSKTAYKNNQATSLDAPPKIVNNRTLIPLRFVSEALGANVNWNEDNQTISIRNNNYIDNKVTSNKATGTSNINLSQSEDIGNKEYNLLGNSSGNIENRGHATQEQGWIYFCTYESGLFKMKLDGTDTTVLSQGQCITNINVKDGWVYYLFSNCIYKIKTDGTEKTLLLKENGSIDKLIVIGDWIYFRYLPNNNDSRGYIIKIKNDGTEMTKISNITTQTLYYDNGWFYTDLNVELTKIKIDGSEIIRLADEQPEAISVTNDWIYYETVVDWQNKIFARHSIKKDGSNSQKVDEGTRNYFMNFSGDWLYYTAGAYDKGILYKMKPDATSRSLILNEKVCFINVVGEWIIYQDGWNGETRRIKIDGTNKSRFVNGVWQDVS